MCFLSCRCYPHYDDPQIFQAVSTTKESQGELVDLFERIENFFVRLEAYMKVPPTFGMTDMIVKIMVQVLSVLTIATKEVKQNRASECILGNDHDTSFIVLQRGF